MAVDSAPGFLDLEASFLAGVNDSAPGFLDLEASFLRPVTHWVIRSGSRYPVWPRVPAPGFQPKAAKPSGLVSVNPASASNMSTYGADLYVAKIAWSDIEPSQGAYNWAPIDSLLAARPSMRMTLRIQAGNDAPAWLKTASGGAMELYNVSRDITVWTARWWTTVAMNAWQVMIEAAGARYDSDLRVVLVSADLPMVVYSEPFILGSHNPSGQALYAAGCNLVTHTNSIKRCVSDTCRAFPTSRVELAIHSDFQYPIATGVAKSWPLGRQIALDLMAEWKNQLVFSDYGLQTIHTLAAKPITGTLQTEPDVYAWMRLRSQTAPELGGGPVGYQLTPKGMTTKPDYMQMAQNAIDHGGWYCETSGWGTLGSDFTFYDTALKTQAAAGGI